MSVVRFGVVGVELGLPGDTVGPFNDWLSVVGAAAVGVELGLPGETVGPTTG